MPIATERCAIMSSIDIFKAHHAEIRSLINSTSNYLSEDQAVPNIDALWKNLQALFKIITVHLNTEDTLLYPEMLDSGNSKVSKLAKEYQTDMGWIVDSFKDFMDYWPLQKIASDPVKFCHEMHKIIHSLKERIDKEERYLYPQFELAVPAN